MNQLQSIAPQFLVDDLEAAISYYVERLGFEQRIDYEGFYASVARDAAEIHLKCAPKREGQRQHQQDNDHVDALIVVQDIDTLFGEFKSQGARMLTEIETHPWGARDVLVRDIDGYRISFAQMEEHA